MDRTDLRPFALRAPGGDPLELLDDLDELTPRRHLDATAPAPDADPDDLDVFGQPAADRHLTGDPRDWRRVMAEVKARMADAIALHYTHGEPDMGPDTDACASAWADVDALDAPVPHGTLRAVRGA